MEQMIGSSLKDTNSGRFILDLFVFSSISIVSDYRLEDGVRSPAEAKKFSPSLCVWTSSETQPASNLIGTRRGSFTWG
jgi:hypothetical protein